jgi:hypothetical protein
MMHQNQNRKQKPDPKEPSLPVEWMLPQALYSIARSANQNGVYEQHCPMGEEGGGTLGPYER